MHSVTSSTSEPTYPSDLFSAIHFEFGHCEYFCTIVSWPCSPYHWLTTTVCRYLYSWRNLCEKEYRGGDSIDNTLGFVLACCRDKNKHKPFVMSFSLTVLLIYLSKSCDYQAGTDLIIGNGFSRHTLRQGHQSSCPRNSVITTLLYWSCFISFF